MADERTYVTDDADIDERRHKLVMFRGENGDWYLSIMPEADRFSRACVRVTTHGTRRHGMPGAMSTLWNALATGPAVTGAELVAGLAGCISDELFESFGAEQADATMAEQLIAARAERDRLRALLAAYGRAVDLGQLARREVEAIEAEAAKWREWG